VQAGVVLGPRRVDPPVWIRRLQGPGWALVPIASIVGVIFAIRYASSTADWLTYLALVAVPVLAAVALGGAMRGGRPWLAMLAVPLFAVAWAWRSSLSGQAAGAVLDALSCVTLGMLLGLVTPPSWLAAGILLMTAADVWLVTSDLLQAPNATLVGAAPAGGLPQLQSASFGSVNLGYGDLFVAGLLGAAVGRWGRPLWPAALLTLAFAGLFDLLFLVLDELPATVPVALALLAEAGWALSASRRRSRPGAATPRRAR
jgi:hypothetical protein